MLVSADLSAVSHTSLEYEVSVDSSRFWAFFVWIRRLITWIEGGQEGLYHVIAMDISWQFKNIRGKRIDQQIYFQAEVLDVGT